MNSKQKGQLADSLSSALDPPRRKVAALDSILADYGEPSDRQEAIDEQMLITGNPVSQVPSLPGAQSPGLGTQSPAMATQSPSAGSQFTVNQANSTDSGTQSPAMATQSPNVGDWEPSLPVSQSPSSLQARMEASYPSRQERTKKGWRILNTQLEQLVDLAYITGADEQDLVGEALEMLFQKYFGGLGTQSPSLPVSQVPSLPQINSGIELTKNNLIRLYEELTGWRWDSHNDELHYATIMNFPLEAIELGIRLAKQRADKAKSLIRTFKYCLNPINEAARMDETKRRQKLLHLRFEQSRQGSES